MEESTFLSRSFADQGLKIRIRRLAKRDRKELELIDQSMSNRLKRQRGDGKRDDNDSGDSSDVDMHDRTPNADDSRSKLSSEPVQSSSYDKRKERSPSSPRRGPYDIPPHMAHYDPNAPMYGPGYPPHRPHPWHDRPEYMADPHYPPPYYDPYDRRYGYHPYYYPPPPPLPDSADHHRYPYPPAYGRPPMYPGQPTPGYYDTPPRVGHPANESPGAIRPYGYDPSSPYPPPQRGGPWPHYSERSQSRDPNLESSSSPYRGSGPVTPPPPPRGHPMYYPPHDYYAPYAHMGPPPPKQDYAAPIDPSITGDPSNPQNKIPIQDLLSTEQQQQQTSQSSQSAQSNTEQSATPPSRMYGGPPSAFALYPHHPARQHEYMRDMYSRPPYDMMYPPHDASQYQSAGSSSSPVNKSQPTSQPPPPPVSQGDAGRASLMPATSTQTPSSSSSEPVRQENRSVEYGAYDARRSAYSEPLTSTGNSSVSSAQTTQASSYSGMPVIPTATRALPPPLYTTSSSGGNSIPPYHPATSTSSLHTSASSSQQLKSPPRTQTPQSSYEHPQSYSQSRGSYGINTGSDHSNGSNSSKNNGVNSNLGSGNEKTTSPRYDSYQSRRQGDVEDERKNVNESVGGGEKY